MEFYFSDQEDGVNPSMLQRTDSKEIEPNANHDPDSTLLEAEDLEVEQQLLQGYRQRITFFNLPDTVKRRILVYAGLLRPCLITINNEQCRAKRAAGLCSNSSRISRPSWYSKWSTPYTGTCDHPALPVGVFLASRAARQELGALFFAHNRYSALIFGRQDYKFFSLATQWGLLHLRHLDILLGGQDRYLKNGRGVHRTVLNIWSEFCQNATERMPSLRYFSMKCKVKELDIASRLMCSMDPFPTLAHCAFHFSDVEHDDIRPVIKRAAWRLTGNLSDTESRPSFPYLKLPREIQLMILDQLLTECSDPWLPAAERHTGMIGFLDRQASPRRYSFLACCGTCSPVGSMCFCEIRQTAFSTSCSCFTSPLPYFLVSRSFYEDCRHIFFSKNRFALVEEEPEPIMRILNSIPTSSFMQIRQLSFKIPMVYRGHRSTSSVDATLSSWSVLRRFIREHFDLPRLSLSVVVPELKSSYFHHNKSKRQILTTFLAGMQDLRDFRVYLADDPSLEKELELLVLGRNTVGRYKPWPNMSLSETTQSTSA
ncbi:uncharacterized protein BDV17DRAFT_287337 [Aspergillus undulatus]|uniref:uncharacterized protein n=1 Tax=Aspergillus undulatus TaxID=1810928 RepID=UPI003CCD57DB